MIIQTYKIKHGHDFSKELLLARKVANFSLKTKSLSSKDVRHIGLKSMISNQILRKYSKSKTIKKVTKVNLAVPNQGIKIIDKRIYVPCLKLYLNIYFDWDFIKINQIEVNKEYAFISVSYNTKPKYEYHTIMGVDRNTNKHVLVSSNLQTGKVLKLGKLCQHTHNKYKNIRQTLQKKNKLKKLKTIKHRERDIVKNINHQISKKIVIEAVKSNACIVLENLKGIRANNNKKCYKERRYFLNSWSFYQLEQMIKYKAEKHGVQIFYVEPHYTSQECNRCGHIERTNRKSKSLFQCNKCGKVEDADVNAGFNVARKHQISMPRFNADRDVLKGNTDVPKEAMY